MGPEPARKNAGPANTNPPTQPRRKRPDDHQRAGAATPPRRYPPQRMDLRRLRAGEVLLAAAGTLLLVSLFLPWYEGASAETLSGFESLTVVDLLLALTALSAIAIVPITASQRVPAVPIALEALLTIAGMLATVLVLIRVANLPGDAASRDLGLWPALAGALGIVVGGFVAMRDERRSPGGRHVDLSGRPVPPPAELETLPAPRPDVAQ